MYRVRLGISIKSTCILAAKLRRLGMCPLSTLKNKMTARKGERSIVTILETNGAMNSLIHSLYFTDWI